MADDRDVADVVDGVETLHGRDGVLAVDRQRVLALDPVLVEVVDALLAHADQAVGRRADDQHADARVVGERPDEVGIELIDPSSVIRSLLALK